MTPAELTRRVNAAAVALGEARATHDRKPTDAAYRVMLEAENAYLKAELARREYQIAREKNRSAEIGRRYRKTERLLRSAVKPRRMKCKLDSQIPLLALKNL